MPAAGRWLIVAAVVAWSAGVLAAEAPGPGPSAASSAVAVTPRQRQQMVELSKTALGSDAAASARALQQLEAMGEPARPRLAAAVRELLIRDRGVVAAAGRRLSDPQKAKALADDLAAVRASALENIAKLKKDQTIQIAHDNYDKLAKMLALMNEVWAVREAVIAVMARRPTLLALWHKYGSGEEVRFGQANEDKLRTEAAAILGMPVEQALAVPEFGQGPEPKDPAARQLWFYRACRRIEAYNRTLEPLMSAAEIENVTILNAYRESLGTLPLEVDARLLQSARRHSKEMVEKGYFAHESPTPSEKTHAMRMANAGYSSGYSENIAAGSASGKATFWQWFDSPGHHQNMVHAGSTAVGVGAWGSTWTQNFGTGARLMLMDPADRAKEVVKGPIVPPQGSSAVPARSAM